MSYYEKLEAARQKGIEIKSFLENELMKRFKDKESDGIVKLTELFDRHGLSKDRMHDNQIVRASITSVKKNLKKLGFVLVNVRNSGYKISRKFEAIDDAEKRLIRISRQAMVFIQGYLNNTLDISDILQDPDRTKQHEALAKAMIQISTALSQIEVLISESKFYSENSKSTECSDVHKVINDLNDLDAFDPYDAYIHMG